MLLLLLLLYLVLFLYLSPSAIPLYRHIKSPPVSSSVYQANLISMLTMLMKMSWNIQRTISCVLFATISNGTNTTKKREKKIKPTNRRRNGSTKSEKRRNWERPSQSDEMEIESAHCCHCRNKEAENKKNKHEKTINIQHVLLHHVDNKVGKSIKYFYLCSISHGIAI